MNKLNILSKLMFVTKRSLVIIIIGQEKDKLKKEIEKVLNINPKNKNNTLIIVADNKNINTFNFFLKHSQKSIFVIGKINSLKKDIEKTINTLPKNTTIVLNNDTSIKERIKKLTKADVLSYGFSKDNNLIAINNETGLKIDYKGNVVPVWFKGRLHKNIYSILSALAVGLVLGLNLVKMSQMFKEDNI